MYMPTRSNRRNNAGWDTPPGEWGTGQEWGPPAPPGGGWGTSPATNKPCVCHLIPQPKTAKPLDPDASDEGETEEPAVFDGIIDRKEHFLVREQIWYQGIQQWLPYDASRFYVPVPEQDLGNYFYVNIRHMIPGDEGELVLTNFSEVLLKFLRTSYGDEFYDATPERYAETLLPDIPIFQTKLAAIEQHLNATQAVSLADKRTFAVSLGCQEAKQATHPESYIDQFIKEAKEHITVLYDHLLELYKPKAEKLALQLSDGCVEFGLLVFYYELNQRYCLDPFSSTKAIGFRLEHRSYESNKTSLRLSGTAYSWAGTDYIRVPISRQIAAYRGTLDLGLLDCQPVTPEIDAALVARGRLYTALSGCHYRSYLKDRIIVDKIGYDTAPDGYGDRQPNEIIPEFPEENLWMLPGCVLGFNLTKKIWTVFPVHDIGPVVFDDNAWDHLVLDPEVKILIKSLVQVTRNSNTANNSIISDVITGKGGGLIAVLHGNPGTGKTLTAEAVAENLKRPLYIVGASELSTKPEVLEEKLKSILSLATAWDAVLLIDEADVFLEQRSLHEIERNSLVSVALRVLEYHRGVLFLTTNRIHTFDAAFLSRFSIAIKYPEHDLDSRRVIWRKFFEMAGVKAGDSDTSGSGRSTPTDMIKLDDPTKVAVVSDAELDALAEKPFNGRTIKNLVRTAQALALSANEPMSKYHVDIVVRSQEKFLREFAAAQ
ncbi:P-loop containing nucleoside triphosphate hydrolase protein [Roridomyces roridus]|uniref:P-loop containing nucleoside triphosphate hydrolase protein n=1 Tax=Roridomyces roridus TaxID=1738132 RepID=A0AAD7FVG2_9AGAR|nr:P-loop containing nucleoside triphosphate hydrolase protein [Roridomyces roridus]